MIGLTAAWVTTAALASAPLAHAYLSTRNISPFPASRTIVGATWTSPRYGPPSNQWGDILPTVWADDDDQYTMVDDGGADVSLPGAVLRATAIELMGSGLGSVPMPRLLAAIRGVFDAAAPAALSIDTRTVPLAAVGEHWADTDSRTRTVFVMRDR